MQVLAAPEVLSRPFGEAFPFTGPPADGFLNRFMMELA